MADTNEQTSVTRNEAQNRYEIHVGDALGGYTEYVTDADGRVVFPATEIDPQFKGQGLGSILVSEAMTDAAKRGDTVVPQCSFVAHYLRKHDVPGLSVDWPAEAPQPG